MYQARNPYDHEGQPQMGGKPIRGDIKHLARQTRGDHPPTDGPLDTPQNAGDQKARGPAGGDAFSEPEEQEPRRPDKPDKAAQLAVAPFPPVDEFELFKAHTGVLKLVFWESGGTFRIRPPRPRRSSGEVRRSRAAIR